MKQTPTTLGAFRSADIATIPIASGVLTITSAMVIAQAESGTADDIATITPDIESINATDRYFVMIEADAGDTLTLKHGTGNLTLKGAADIELTGGQRALLFGSATLGFTDFAVSSASGGSGDTLPVVDTTALVKGSVDDTKQFRIEVDGFTAGQTRVATPPDENFTMMGLATVQTPTNKTISASANTVGVGSGVTKTIATGVASAGTDRNLVIAAESGTADDLIEVTGLVVGESVLLRADAGDTITVVHNSGSATVKIHLHGNANITLDEQNPLRLTLVATNVLVEDVQPTSSGSLTKVVGTGTYTPGANITTNSTTPVDIDATNVKQTVTLNGGGVVIAICTLECNKVTAGNMFFRWTDGTNNSNEVPARFLTSHDYVITFIGVFDGLAAGSTTFKPQFRSSDANNAQIIANLPITWSVLELS